MKHRKPMSAWLLSTCLALVLVLFTYVSFTKVDLVFTKDGYEIHRQESVCALSKIDDPSDNIPEGIVEEGEEISFTYSDGEETVDFDHSSFAFRVKIAKTLLTNLIEFDWSENSRIVVLTAK